MEFLKKLFPLRAKAQEKNTLIRAIIIYAVVMIAMVIFGAIIGAITGLIASAMDELGEILALLVSGVVGFFGFVINTYCTGGIVVSILSFLNVIKE